MSSIDPLAGEPTLEIQALEEAGRPEITERVLDAITSDFSQRFELSAGAHRVVYGYVGEIPWGSALYETSVHGPHGPALSEFLRGRRLLYARALPAPYHARRDWYLFEENDERNRHILFHVFDLGSGQLLCSQTLPPSASFLGWRTEASELVHSTREGRRTRWYAFDVLARRSRPVGLGGGPAWLTADGQYLLVCDSRPVRVTLFSIAEGKQVACRTAADMRHLVPRRWLVRNVQSIGIVGFDGRTAKLTALLNWRRTDVRARHVDYDRAIAITIVPPAGLTSVPPSVA